MSGEIPEIYFCDDCWATAGAFAREIISTSDWGGRTGGGCPSTMARLLRLPAAAGPPRADLPERIARPRLSALRAIDPAAGGRAARVDRRCGGPGLFGKRRGHPAGDRVGPDGGRGDPGGPRRLPAGASRFVPPPGGGAVRPAAGSRPPVEGRPSWLRRRLARWLLAPPRGSSAACSWIAGFCTPASRRWNCRSP